MDSEVIRKQRERMIDYFISNQDWQPSVLLQLARMFKCKAKLLEEKNSGGSHVQALEARLKAECLAVLPLLEDSDNDQSFGSSSIQLYEFLRKSLDKVELTDAIEEDDVTEELPNKLSELTSEKIQSLGFSFEHGKGARPNLESTNSAAQQVVHAIESLKQENRENRRELISKLDELIKATIAKEEKQKAQSSVDTPFIEGGSPSNFKNQEVPLKESKGINFNFPSKPNVKADSSLLYIFGSNKTTTPGSGFGSVPSSGGKSEETGLEKQKICTRSTPARTTTSLSSTSNFGRGFSGNPMFRGTSATTTTTAGGLLSTQSAATTTSSIFGAQPTVTPSTAKISGTGKPVFNGGNSKPVFSGEAKPLAANILGPTKPSTSTVFVGAAAMPSGGATNSIFSSQSGGLVFGGQANATPSFGLFAAQSNRPPAAAPLFAPKGFGAPAATTTAAASATTTTTSSSLVGNTANQFASKLSFSQSTAPTTHQSGSTAPIPTANLFGAKTATTASPTAAALKDAGSNKTTRSNTSGFLFSTQPPTTPPSSGGGEFTFGSPRKSFDFQFQAKSPPIKSPERPETSDDEQVEESDDVYFAPVIPLPNKVDVKTGEEDEEVVYCHRAKLFRFDPTTKEWKERGLGDIKLLRHPDTKKSRLVMRRQQVLKICLNHALTASLKIRPKDDKTWMWTAGDHSNGKIEYLQFACRFKTPQIAEEFKAAIDNALQGGDAVTPVSKPKPVAKSSSSSDIEVVYELKVTPEERAAALKLKLPENFYSYKYKDDCPGCQGCNESDESLFKSAPTKPILVKANDTPSSTTANIFNKIPSKPATTQAATIGAVPKLTFGSTTAPPIFGSAANVLGDADPNFTFEGAGASVVGAKAASKTPTKPTPNKAKNDEDDESEEDDKNETEENGESEEYDKSETEENDESSKDDKSETEENDESEEDDESKNVIEVETDVGAPTATTKAVPNGGHETSTEPSPNKTKINDGIPSTTTTNVFRAKDDSGWTVLHSACADGNLDFVKFLVEKGADVNAKNESNETVLHYSCALGKIDIVAFLVEKGADINVKGYKGETALHYAARNEKWDIVTFLVDKGADVQAKDDDGRTVLQYAAKCGGKDIIEFLIDKGADVQTKNNFGETALHLVAYFGCHFSGILGIIKLLVEKGADVNATNNVGWATLHYCSRLDHHFDVLKCLVEIGANVHAKTNNGETALHIASRHVCFNTVEFLVDNGADVNAKDKAGTTALHCASQSSSFDIAKCLIENGADVGAKNKNGQTALDFARKVGNLNIVRYLIEKGCRS